MRYNTVMELFLIGHDHAYAVEQIMLMLFPGERPVYPEKPGEGMRAEISLSRGEKRDTAVCRLYRDGKRYDGRSSVDRAAFSDELTRRRLEQRIVKLSFYRAAVLALGEKPAWGALSGIRPAVLMRRLLEDGLSEKAAVRRFMQLYDTSAGRAALCLDAARAGLAADKALGPRDVCLYVGVPFCPTRCAYCSFVSNSVEKSLKFLFPFTEALLQDIAATGVQAEKNGLRPVSVYFGGGTPTTLDARALDEVCAALEKHFDLSALREFTVEAGRPDTITAEKLAVLKAHGVTRVSVNPQSMSDRVLAAIGRRHTARDVFRALELVRDARGLAVNMDLIAGLPEDTVNGFAATLETVLSLAPENITVHTLALKKGSRIMLEGTRAPEASEVGEMLDFAQRRLRGADYQPYYLYRQKYMSGGFENVGWTRPGFENLYNICIMEELRSILAMGGGASTKLVSGTGRIERVFAPKYPLEYIQSIEKVCRDKEKISGFYQS